MDVILFLLFFLSFIVLIIGIIKPKIVIRWGSENDKIRKNVLKYYGAATLILFIVCVIYIGASNPDVKSSSQLPNTVQQNVTASDKKIAAGIDEKIKNLGDADSITLDKSSNVSETKQAYEALTSNQKKYVKNISTLEKAEDKITDLQAAADKAAADKAAADKVAADKAAADKAAADKVAADKAAADKAAADKVAADKAAADKAAADKTENKPAVSTPSQSQNTEYTVYITKSGKKYHRAGCRYLSRSQIGIPKSEAISQGYTPCSVCNP